MNTSKVKSCYVLLDRDGTLIEERHYLSKPEQVALIAGASLALKSLMDANIGIVLLTNQSGLARGYFDRQDLNSIHGVLQGMLSQDEVVLDGIYICPHLPEAQCDCRKPRSGLAVDAAKDIGFKLPDCIVVGDKACDIELGKQISARTILVETGHGKEQSLATRQNADWVAPSIVEACKQIIAWKCQIQKSGQEEPRYE